MGSSQSSRNISVSNPEDNIIVLSAGVVNRLRGTAEDAESNPPPTGQREPTFDPESPRTSRPTYIPGYSPISSMQMRKEVQAAQDKLDKKWQERVNLLVKGQEKSKTAMENEFKKSLNEIQKAFKGYNTERYTNPCVEIQATLTKCYSDNPSKPLNCAEQVRAFSSCVQDKHDNMIKART